MVTARDRSLASGTQPVLALGMGEGGRVSDQRVGDRGGLFQGPARHVGYKNWRLTLVILLKLLNFAQTSGPDTFRPRGGAARSSAIEEEPPCCPDHVFLRRR